MIRLNVFIQVEKQNYDQVVSIAKELVAEKGMYMDSSVIAHPDKRMIDTIL